MRAAVDDLISPHPVGRALPALYQGDDFAQRLSVVFDNLLAPVVSALDNLHAYLDAHLSPDDFLRWLGGWVGLNVTESPVTERSRALVGRMVEIHRSRGTARGLREHLAVSTGYTPEIIDSGHIIWSTMADTQLPEPALPEVIVRLMVPEAEVDEAYRRVDAVVTTAKPAHVLHRIEVTPL